MQQEILIPKLNQNNYIFPDPKLSSKEGLVAWGGDLNPLRLITAYKNGIFPWYSQNDPILWWSPDPRLVLFLNEFKISKSLKKSIKKYQVKFNTDFEKVISNCKDVREMSSEGTWIDENMKKAYIKLHKMGYAYSVETYYDNELIGGLYGVIIGKVFCGESMFSKKSDASKVALAFLVEKLKKDKFHFIDCQTPTSHLISLGAREISRDEFLFLLRAAI